MLISTHQVEEVEHILSDVIFLRDGEVILYRTMDDLRQEFLQVITSREQAGTIRALGPLTEHELFGKKVFIMRNADRAVIEPLGEVTNASVADIFVALMGGAA